MQLQNEIKVNLNEVMGLAKFLHKKGELEEAAKLYLKALDNEFANVEANRLLGNIALQKQEYLMAIELLERAIKFGLKTFDVYYELGLACSRAKQLDRAKEFLEKAVKKEHRSHQIHNELAAVCAYKKLWKNSKTHFEKSLAMKPDQADVWLRLARIEINLGNSASAIIAFNESYNHDAGNTKPLVELLQLYQAEGNQKAVIDTASRIVEVSSTNPTALSVLGEDFEFKNQLDEASDCYMKAAMQYSQLKQPDEAEKYLEAALRLSPNSPIILSNAAVYYHHALNWELAGDFFKQSIDLEPKNALFYYNFGCFLRDRRDWLEAKKQFEKALSLDPNFPSALMNLGKIEEIFGNHSSALTLFAKAKEVDPSDASIRLNLGMTLLKHQDFEKGWFEYEWRVQARTGQEYLNHPIKTNELLPRPSSALMKNKVFDSIVLLPDQGLGDVLFFSRVIPQLRLAEIGIKLNLPLQLDSLFLDSDADLTRVVGTNDISDNDLCMSFSELPLFSTEGLVDKVPPPLVLKPVSSLVNRLRKELDVSGSGPYIAVCWEAGIKGTLNEQSLFKRVSPDSLGRALSDWPGTIISIQRNAESSDEDLFRSGLGRSFLNMSHLNDDLQEMLALLSLVDNYAGVSCTNVHLLASLGKPANVFVPIPYEWRWISGGDKSPWFPTFNVLRENVESGWDNAFEDLRKELFEIEH